MRAEVAQTTILGVIVGMALINFGLRYLPIAILSRITLPRPVTRWLSYVPIAVMGALVANEVGRPGGEWRMPLTSPYIWAAIVTAVVFRLSKSFLGATLAGIGSFIAFRAVL